MRYLRRVQVVGWMLVLTALISAFVISPALAISLIFAGVGIIRYASELRNLALRKEGFTSAYRRFYSLGTKLLLIGASVFLLSGAVSLLFTPLPFSYYLLFLIGAAFIVIGFFDLVLLRTFSQKVESKSS